MPDDLTPVLGIRAATPRLTPAGAALIAAALALTGGAVIGVVAWALG